MQQILEAAFSSVYTLSKVSIAIPTILATYNLPSTNPFRLELSYTYILSCEGLMDLNQTKWNSISGFILAS